MTDKVFPDKMNHAVQKRHPPPQEMLRHCHRLSYILHVHKVYHLSVGVIRCRIYTGLSIGMSIEGHLASIIRRINAIFQRWIPGNDSFQINGGKEKHDTPWGEIDVELLNFPTFSLSSQLSAQLSSSMRKVRRHYKGRSLKQDIKKSLENLENKTDSQLWWETEVSINI